MYYFLTPNINIFLNSMLIIINKNSHTDNHINTAQNHTIQLMGSQSKNPHFLAQYLCF